MNGPPLYDDEEAQDFENELEQLVKDTFENQIELANEAMEGVTVSCPGDGTDWVSEDPQSDGRISYMALCEKPCCDDPTHTQVEDAWVLLSPMVGFGVGSVVNALDRAGLRLVHLTTMPSYMTEVELEKREAEFMLRKHGLLE